MNELVKSLLSRIDSCLDISDFPTDISDLIITEKETGLRFVAEIKSNDISKEQLIGYLDKVAEAVSDQGMPRLPLVLFLVNGVEQPLKAAIVVESHFGMPLINHDITFVELTYETWPQFFDTIKSADSTIRLLTDINFRIVKRISFRYRGERHEGIAHLLYLRKFRPDYRMKPREIQSRQQQFELYLNGIPEEDYPHDDLDNMVLEAVKSQYQNAEVKSSLLMMNTELRDLRNELSRNKVLEGRIIFKPSNQTSCVLNGVTFHTMNVAIITDPITGAIEPQSRFSYNCQVQSIQEYAALTNYIDRTSEDVIKEIIV